MLDTDTVSNMLRHPQGEIAQWLTVKGEDNVCVSLVSAGELRFGAAKSGSARLAARVQAVLARLPVIPLDVPTDVEYGRIRAELTAAGRLIGPNDLLIAAHACALGATLVTGNVREFGRVSGLTVENWVD